MRRRESGSIRSYKVSHTFDCHAYCRLRVMELGVVHAELLPLLITDNEEC